MPATKYKNTILQSFDQETIARLHLKRMTFKVGHEIEYPGRPIAHLYFLEEGMASMTATYQNGSQVEVGMFGCESVIGFSALMGTKLSLNRVYTQIAGWGYQMSFRDAKSEFERGNSFQRMGLRYVQAQLLQAMQSAGCNARHTIEQRLARWLLLCADRVGSTKFNLSQEFLSHMLGTTRPSVTAAAGPLKRDNLITYKWGKMDILDRPGLEQRSCECYRVIQQHLDDFLAFDTAHVG